ncbi:C40 family peptidase [Mycolicibacterium frederiksbergense]|nr:C40 family peptidase [Mycolicibacterium frederiksbergense]
MGMARESFGTGGGLALAPPPELPTVPDRTGDGSGRAADGFADESGVVVNHLEALAEHDAAGKGDLEAAVASAGASRGRMDAVIAAAVADVQSKGLAVNTPAGQQALVLAIKRHLEDTKSTLDQGGNDASTHAAAADTTAAGYQSIGRPPGGAATMMPMMPQMPQMPMGGGGMGGGMPMGAMPMAPLGMLSNLLGGGGGGAGQAQQGIGAHAGSAAGSDIAGTGGPQGDRIVKSALSQLGVPYAWGGTTPGKGLDCSGLVQYAYSQAGIKIPRTTYDMTDWGVRVRPEDARPGDILLCNRRDGEWQHVQLVMNDHQTIEAPSRGQNVRIGKWPSGGFEIRRAA